MTESPTGGPVAGVPTCYRHRDRESYVRCQRCDRPICPECMRDAAVGFQCASCVAEGAKSTRSGRTAYGGQRSANPTATSLTLIVANAAVWLLVLATGGAASRWVDRLALIPRGRCLAGNDASSFFPNVTEQTCRASGGVGVWVDGVADGAWWQLLTSAFTHVEPWHIGFNMLALWVLGPQLELAVGRARFLALYLLSALAGATMVYWLENPAGATLGASGAIFGLMGALLVVAVKVRGNVRSILTWILINAMITVVGRGFISWEGHLGGFVGGVLIGAILVYAPRARRTAWQSAALAGLTAVLLVLVLVRTVGLAG